MAFVVVVAVVAVAVVAIAFAAEHFAVLVVEDVVAAAFAT